MDASVIRYRTTAAQAAPNRQLIEKVFTEVEQVHPAGLRYRCVQLGAEGTEFVHVVESEHGSPLAELATFQEFQRGLRDRLDGELERLPAQVVGSYAPGAAVGVALAFLDAFVAGDEDALAGLLDPEVIFTSPRRTLVGKVVVAAEIAGFARAVTALEVVSAFGDDEHALVLYDMHAGLLGTIRAADRITVRGGRIITDELLFDTAALG
jgi:hypothetical protein